jgi:hypothetical protein
MDKRISSPSAPYPHQQYQHHPEASNPGGIANGGQAPQAAMQAEGAHERPASVASKRIREWEDEAPPVKKAASDENRARMEDVHHRRPSTPPHEVAFRRSSSEARRAEEQRRANENYHPSEAAHHMHVNNTAVNQQQQLPPMRPVGTPARENIPAPAGSRDHPNQDRRSPQQHQQQPQIEERAARKMDVDENYDDDDGDDKKPSANGPDGKNTSPRSVNGQGNGYMGGQTKVESQV